jgi:uncharacterized membrane protein
MQTKQFSLLEAVTNTAIAFVITLGVLPIVNWLCGVAMSNKQMGLHVLLMTIVSIIRNYIIRRFFNKLK